MIAALVPVQFIIFIEQIFDLSSLSQINVYEGLLLYIRVLREIKLRTGRYSASPDLVINKIGTDRIFRFYTITIFRDLVHIIADENLISH